MKLTIKRGATIEDLEATPEGVNGQLIDGDLFTTTRPSNAHAAAITELLLALGPFTRDRKLGWVVVFEPEVLYGKNVLIGDLVGWRRARMPVIPDVKRIELAPDLVCEALSPSSARIDRGRKREIYAKAKVGHLWFVDPLHQTLEVLALDKRGYHVVAIAAGSRHLTRSRSISRCFGSASRPREPPLRSVSQRPGTPSRRVAAVWCALGVAQPGF